MPSYWLGDDTISEACDQRDVLRDGCFDRWKRQRRVVTGLAVPNFGNPDRVVVACIFGDDVAQTTGHVADALQNIRYQFVSFARNHDEFSDLPDVARQSTGFPRGFS